MEKLYHSGVMRTKVDDCQFVCIAQSDYYNILHQVAYLALLLLAVHLSPLFTVLHCSHVLSVASLKCHLSFQSSVGVVNKTFIYSPIDARSFHMVVTTVMSYIDRVVNDRHFDFTIILLLFENRTHTHTHSQSLHFPVEVTHINNTWARRLNLAN